LATLEGFLDELIAVVRDVSGIAFVPDDPPARLASHPAGVVWLTGGRSVIGPPGLATYHHDVRIGLMTAIENTAVANQRILPQIEPVIEAIWTGLTTSAFVNCQNIEGITYTYGPIQWADIWYFGAIIDLEEVKIQREL
jgi:hypothetical protein